VHVQSESCSSVTSYTPSQISNSAAHVPEKGPTGTGPAGCAAGGAAPKPDTPVRGPVLPPLEPGGAAPGAREPVPAGHHPDRQQRSSMCRSGSDKPRSLAGGLCRAGGSPRSLMPEVPGRMLVTKAGLPVPGRGVRSAPGPTLARARSGGARFPIDRPKHKSWWKSCARPGTV
jgi:hypothetical protein